MFINDGKTEKKIYKNGTIPENWVKGRICIPGNSRTKESFQGFKWYNRDGITKKFKTNPGIDWCLGRGKFSAHINKDKNND
jgi:hypothetical protein